MAKATASKKKPATKKKAAKKSAPKKEAAKTTALTKAQVTKIAKESQARWDKVTTDLRNRRRQAAADVIQYRYDVGMFAISLMEDRSQELGKKLYGDRTVEQLCEALNESSSTVHTCIKFARRCDQKEVEYFKSGEWPWRAVSSIVTVEDAKAYKQLKEDFEKKKFKNTDELKDAAKAVNEQSKKDGTKKDKRGGGSPTAKSTVKSFTTACNALATKVMPGFQSVVKGFSKNVQSMEPSVAEEMTAGIKEGRKALETLKKMTERTDEMLGEIDI